MLNGCRTEKKYIISLAAAAALRERLLPLMRVDSQATDGAYRIRSLYFDTLDADAFWEKVDGWGSGASIGSGSTTGICPSFAWSARRSWGT